MSDEMILLKKYSSYVKKLHKEYTKAWELIGELRYRVKTITEDLNARNRLITKLLKDLEDERKKNYEKSGC